MSLSEVQQIYDLLLKIDSILSGIEVKTEKLNSDLPRTKEAVSNARKYYRLLNQINHLLQHLGLPKEIDAAITKLHRAIYIAYALKIALYGLTLGPIGVA